VSREPSASTKLISTSCASSSSGIGLLFLVKLR
jgi:hypothetical protein